MVNSFLARFPQFGHRASLINFQDSYRSLDVSRSNLGLCFITDERSSE